MNKSITSRILEAKKYQKKAIQALLPESVAGHLEVIEQELLAIFLECTKELMKQKEGEGEAVKDNCLHQENRNIKRTKKVTID